MLQERIVDNHSPTELLEIFPEALPTIKEKKRDFHSSLQDLEDQTEKNIKNIYEQKYEKTVEWVWIQLEKINYETEERKINKHIKRLDNFIRIAEWKRKPPSTSEITDREINAAKEVPLSSITSLQIRPNGFATCPFHSEKTASFKIFKDNRYHCFGCGADGDTIEYIMKIQKLDFLDAVRYLIKR